VDLRIAGEELEEEIPKSQFFGKVDGGPRKSVREGGVSTRGKPRKWPMSHLKRTF
jgi:hypothetical protein